MGKRIAIIQGHPDHTTEHFCHALVTNYVQGATETGHEVKIIDVARLDFPVLRSKQEWDHGSVPSVLLASQEVVTWAEHLLIIYPLWLGDMPALLKAFLEQLFRPGFAIAKSNSVTMWEKRLTGKSAHVVVTMGMPAVFYRWFFRAHSVKNLERNILAFCGVHPIRTTLIGMVEQPDGARRSKWLDEFIELGKKGR